MIKLTKHQSHIITGIQIDNENSTKIQINIE